MVVITDRLQAAWLRKTIWVALPPGVIARARSAIEECWI
jgi:hypothetical protein